jgi:O-antigen/teichoic acid export membrane protein
VWPADLTRRVRRYLAGEGLGATLVKASAGSALVRVSGMFFGFLVGVQLARGLGAERYGVYGLAMSMLALLAIPVQFGLPQLVTRELAHAQVNGDWGEARVLLARCRRLMVITASILAIVPVGWLAVRPQAIDTTLGHTLLAAAVLLPLGALAALESSALRGLQYLVTGQLTNTLLRPAMHSLLLFGVPLLLAMQLSPALAMALGAVAAAFALAVAALLLRRVWPARSPTVDPGHRDLTILRDALPLALTEGLRVLQGHLAIFVLGALATLAAVGHYRVAGSVTTVLAMPMAMFNIVGMPMIARLYAQRDTARLQRLLGWLALAMLGSSLLLTLPFWLEGERLLAWLFGEEFRASGPVLRILAVGVVVNALFGPSAALLNMTRNAKRVTLASAVSIAVLLPLAIVLVPEWGETGAAFAGMASSTIWSLLMWRDGRRLLSLDTSALALLRGGIRGPTWRD